MLSLLSLAAASPELDLAAQVDPDRIEQSLQVLTGQLDADDQGPLVSRNIHHADMPRVEAWLEAELSQWANVEREEFRAERRDLANLVVRFPGSQPELEPVLLGAHYDSTAEAEEGWSAVNDPAPGADDNASGTAALIEAVRLLSEGSYERSIEVVFFSAEEQGLLGSTHHVEQRDQGVLVALILDPVGHNPGGSDWLFGTFDARWESAATSLETTALSVSEELDLDLQVGLIDHETVGGDYRSDHAPFWREDMPALHAGVYPVDGIYHTTADTLDVVDVDFVAQVTALSVAHAARLAEPRVQNEPEGCDTGGVGPLALAGLLLAAFATWLRTQLVSVGREPQSAMPPAIE